METSLLLVIFKKHFEKNYFKKGADDNKKAQLPTIYSYTNLKGEILPPSCSELNYFRSSLSKQKKMFKLGLVDMHNLQKFT